MTDKVEIGLEDLDDLKDLIGDERKRANFSFQKVFSLLVLNWQYWMKIILFALSVEKDRKFYTYYTYFCIALESLQAGRCHTHTIHMPYTCHTLEHGYNMAS